MTPEEEKIDTCLSAAAELLGLQFGDGDRQAVAMHLTIARRMAALLENFPIDDEEESASVYSL